MQGIQQIFRQQAVEKQSSIDSWHSANNTFIPYGNGRSSSTISNDSVTDLKPPIWNQGRQSNFNPLKGWSSNLFPHSDRILEQLHETKMSSSPKSVPSSSQEFNSPVNGHSSCRWKRSSPDPNKMMMGRSPNVIDNNAKRILSTTPSRRASNQCERVGSPSLSGYPVSFFIKFRCQTFSKGHLDF